MKSIEEKITYFPFLGVEGGIPLCKEHEEKYIKEKTINTTNCSVVELSLSIMALVLQDLISSITSISFLFIELKVIG